MSEQTPATDPTTGAPPTRVLRGARYMLEGFAWPFRRHPKLLVYVAIPAAVNVLLFVAFIAVLAYFGGEVITAVAEELSGEHPWYLAWIFWIVEALLWLVVILLVPLFAFVTVYFLGNLVAAPFNDLLSEQVEAIRLGGLEEPFSLKRLLADVGFTIGQELLRLSFFVAVSLVLLLLHLIPVVGTAAYAVLAGWFALLFCALEYLDLPLARRRHRFRTRWGLVWRNKLLCTGFGGAAALLVWVPLLNFVCMPAAVVGGTLLWADLVDAGHVSREAGAGDGVQPPRETTEPAGAPEGGGGADPA